MKHFPSQALAIQAVYAEVRNLLGLEFSHHRSLSAAVYGRILKSGTPTLLEASHEGVQFLYYSEAASFFKGLSSLDSD